MAAKRNWVILVIEATISDDNSVIGPFTRENAERVANSLNRIACLKVGITKPDENGLWGGCGTSSIYFMPTPFLTLADARRAAESAVNTEKGYEDDE